MAPPGSRQPPPLGIRLTPWFDDNNKFAGIVHQERNLTYVLFQGAGHLVPHFVPEAVRNLKR